MLKLEELTNQSRPWSSRWVDENRQWQGEALWFHPNGIVSDRRMFFDDVIHGESISFDNKGVVVQHDVWINGEYLCDYDELSEIDRFELSLKYGVIWF